MLPTHSFIHVVENMPPQQILTHPFCVPAPSQRSVSERITFNLILQLFQVSLSRFR
ncbi:hypothetical protein BDR07DRAFT_1435873 [Suillus spraguei]|nr:hypothetical protein BDR07DRAFT_1435873 [Suillus spraguei]